MSGRIEGLEETINSLLLFGEDGKKGVIRAINATTQKVRTDAIKEIQRGTKSGVVYERGAGQNLSATHQASAPGQAPATDTGTLVSSIKAVRSDFTGFVYSRLDYAFYLEFGTLYMEERPFLRPAVEKNKKYFVERMRKELTKAATRYMKR